MINKQERKDEIERKIVDLRTKSTMYPEKYLNLFQKIIKIHECKIMLRIYEYADITSVRTCNKTISDSGLSESEKAELYINEELFI